jgi:hypothetical protein
MFDEYLRLNVRHALTFEGTEVTDIGSVEDFIE